jgi:aminopeptidase N
MDMTGSRRLLTLACLISCAAHGQNGSGTGIDVQHYGFTLSLSDTTNRMEGRADVTVRFLQARSSLWLDLSGPRGRDTGMRVRAVTERARAVPFVQDREGIRLRTRANPGSLHTYHIVYGGIPTDGLIIGKNMYGHRTFFGDNWPDRARQWLPCVDHPSDKAEVDFIVNAPSQYQVVAPGLKVRDTLLRNGRRLTQWKEKVPIPTKVMVIGVADFAIASAGVVGDIPLYTYVFPENKEQGFRDYAQAARILGYYIRTVGPYAYEKLANVQSKTIFGGMENASAIFYAETSVGSPGIEELMAHEIAHQWFGDAVTETDYRHLWLSEGFATYMSHLYMEDRYGADTLASEMAADRKKVLVFARQHPIPVVDTTISGDYMRLLNVNSYEKGSWVLHMLRRALGDSVFREGLRRYYAEYDGRNASTASLRQVMEAVSGQHLGDWFHQWLYTPGVPQLKVTWERPDTGAWVMRIEQTQPLAFSFPLEYLLPADPTIRRVQVEDRITEVRLPLQADPTTIRFDPLVNLLADIRVMP